MRASRRPRHPLDDEGAVVESAERRSLYDPPGIPEAEARAQYQRARQEEYAARRERERKFAQIERARERNARRYGNY